MIQLNLSLNSLPALLSTTGKNITQLQSLHKTKELKELLGENNNSTNNYTYKRGGKSEIKQQLS